MEEDHTLGNILRWMIMKKYVLQQDTELDWGLTETRSPARPSSFADTGAPH